MTSRTDKFFAYALSIGCSFSEPRPHTSNQTIYDAAGNVFEVTARTLIVPTPEHQARLDKWWADHKE